VAVASRDHPSAARSLSPVIAITAQLLLPEF